MVARQAHNLKVSGSIPLSATQKEVVLRQPLFFVPMQSDRRSDARHLYREVTVKVGHRAHTRCVLQEDVGSRQGQVRVVQYCSFHGYLRLGSDSKQDNK